MSLLVQFQFSLKAQGVNLRDTASLWLCHTMCSYSIATGFIAEKFLALFSFVKLCNEQGIATNEAL